MISVVPGVRRSVALTDERHCLVPAFRDESAQTRDEKEMKSVIFQTSVRSSIFFTDVTFKPGNTKDCQKHRGATRGLRSRQFTWSNYIAQI